ncbi:MAG TPA: hypothetical protein VEQ09_00910, partial [Aquabacterium sp.]|nr:hypothetical protein [Aquabacterium sp.]
MGPFVPQISNLPLIDVQEVGTLKARERGLSPFLILETQTHSFRKNPLRLVVQVAPFRVTYASQKAGPTWHRGSHQAVIVYQASKRQFIHDTFQDDIEYVLTQQYLRSTGRQPSPSEFKAWQNSLFAVGEVLKDDRIPDDMGVALEYTVPQTSKRIDV